MKDNEVGLVLLIMLLLGWAFSLLLDEIVVIPSIKEKEKSIQEYIQHPEKYKFEYVTYNGDTTNIIVTYLK